MCEIFSQYSTMMTDLEIWEAIKTVCDEVGIKPDNFRKQKSNGVLAKKWVAPVFIALKEKGVSVSIESLQGLSPQNASDR